MKEKETVAKQFKHITGTGTFTLVKTLRAKFFFLNTASLDNLFIL